MTWTTHDILEATGGELVCGDPLHRFDGIAIDSRTISAADAFVAIRGEVHDGHRFIGEVVDRGARGVIVGRDRAAELSARIRSAGAVCVAVADTTRALGDLGAFHRRRFQVRMVAITGSNGKTSTRRMTAAVAAQHFAVLEPEKNLNNQIGVPLTLFRLAARHQVAVLELGTNMPGEIARLAEICAPDIGVITNIGPAHLEGLGSLDGVLAEKGSLLDRLNPGGRVVLNADDERLRRLALAAGGRAILFGLGHEADVRAERIQQGAAGIDFDLLMPGRRMAARLHAHGRFMVHNALAAAAAGLLLGVDEEGIRRGLEAASPAAGRMHVSTLPGGVTVIDDTYNANPASMQAALEALQALRGGGRGMLVAGEMRQLGAGAAGFHREVGRSAGRTGIDRLYACGAFAGELADGALEAGLGAGAIVTGSRDEITEALLADLSAGDWVLVKGSRAAGMEAVVRRLRDRAPVGPAPSVDRD